MYREDNGYAFTVKYLHGSWMGLADELSGGKEKNKLRNISTFKRREGVIEL